MAMPVKTYTTVNNFDASVDGEMSPNPTVVTAMTLK
jgi:hypothetical protein